MYADDLAQTHTGSLIIVSVISVIPYEAQLADSVGSDLLVSIIPLVPTIISLSLFCRVPQAWPKVSLWGFCICFHQTLKYIGKTNATATVPLVAF